MTVPVEEPPRAKQKLEHASTAPDGSDGKRKQKKHGQISSHCGPIISLSQSAVRGSYG